MELSPETRGTPHGPSAEGERLEAPPRHEGPFGEPGPRRPRATPEARRARGIALAAAAALAVCACEPYVQGNGVYLEEDRSGAVAPFAGVDVQDGVQATVTAAASSQSVVVSGDANVVPYVRTEVWDESVAGLASPVPTLHVWVDLKDFDTTVPVRAVIKAGELRYLSASESRSSITKVDVRDAAAEHVVVDASDRAEVLLRGPGGVTLDATLDDAALDAGSYAVQVADVALTTNSRVELHADALVTGTALGGSEVDNQLGSGACSVEKDESSLVSCQRYAP